MTRFSLRAMCAVAFVLTSCVVVGCSVPTANNDTTTTEDLSSTTEAPVVVTPPTTSPADNGASIYILKPDSDRLHLVPVWRGVDATPKSALTELLRGLTLQDGSDQLVTALPERLVIDKFETQGDLVAVQFESGLETLSDPDRQAAVGQIVYTLTQFDGVARVSISYGSTPVAVPGLGPAVGLTRDAFLITGLINNLFVDRPAWHEPVAIAGIPISGKGLDTVDTNLNYEIQGAGGTVLQDGFVTTTGAVGWATFVDFLGLPVTAKGELHLVLYEPVAGTGEHRFTQIIPVQVQ